MEAVKKFVFITFAGIFLLGCNAEDINFDNVKGPNLSGTFGFPLGEVKYTMRELIDNIGGDDLNLEEDSLTSVLTIFYRDTIAYSTPDDLVVISDIVDGGSIPVPAVTGPTTPNFEISDILSVAYNPQNEEKLDSIYYASGTLEATVTSSFNGTLSYTLTFENTRNIATDSPIVLSGTVIGEASNTQTQDLTNHITRLTDASSNEFSVGFMGTISLDASQSTETTDSVRIDFAYRNQTFSAVFGKFGRDTLAVGNQEIDLGFFNDIGDQGIEFGNPKMRFVIRNTFGVNMGMDLSGVAGDDGEGGSAVSLSGNIVSNPPLINGATELGTTVESIFEINKENSNLDDLLASSPTRLLFNVSGLTNPRNRDVLGSNFIEPNSRIDAYIEMEIPMDLKVDGLEQTDTISLGNGLNISDIDSAFLRIHTLNELPFAASLTMEIQDSTNTTIYTIPNTVVLEAPFVNTSGFVTDPSGETADIPFSKEGIEALGSGTHIVMKVTLNTPQSLTSRDIFVKLLADYSIEIKVGIGGKLNIGL